MKKRTKTFCVLSLLLILAIGPAAVGTKVSRAQDSYAHDDGEVRKVRLGFVPGRILVGFKSKVSKSQSLMMMAAAGVRPSQRIQGTRIQVIELPDFADEEAYIEYFRARPEVEFAELDQILAPEEMTPNDPWYSNWQWHLRKIECPSAWSINTGSSNITIAILDTGVDATHEDLAIKMVPGWNIYNNNSETSDVYGHGTKVAGVAAAYSNNNVGVASVAWGCNIMPVRVSDASGLATYSAIASGLSWAADHGARVANISYDVSDSTTVRSAAQYFQSKGGVVAVSAGNAGIVKSSSDNPYVLTVSGSDPNDALYSWSNTGNNVDLAAPGCVGATTARGGGYPSACGTSFSAPIVAGVAALMLSLNPDLTASEVQDILKQSSDDFDSAGWDKKYGWGRVNAYKALSMAAGGDEPTDSTPPIVSITAPVNTSTVAGIVTVQASASDNVGVTSVSFSLDGKLLGSDATAPYALSWDSNTLSNGTHILSAVASDAAGNGASHQVTITVSNLAADTEPPSISVTSPANGSIISATVSVSVSATDNVGVKKVDLYVDGQLISTSTTAPFTMKWNARKAAKGIHRLQCKAYDATGNSGASTVVTVYK